MNDTLNHKEKALLALSTVNDPDLKKDLVSLGMIENLNFDLESRSLNFTIVLTTPACPLREIIKSNCIKALNIEGFQDWKVDINFSSKISTNIEISKILPGVKNTVAFVSGKGGVGKSTVCFRTALSLSKKGSKVGILDADIFGPSIPLLLGTSGQTIKIRKINEKNYMIPIEKNGIKTISIDYLLEREEVPVIWRGPIASKALKQLCFDSDWGELDYLFIDMPPGTSDLHITLSQSIPLTGVVIITTPQKLACADATKAIEMFKNQFSNISILGLIENMSYFINDNTQFDLFGSGEGESLARKYNIPFLGKIPLLKSIADEYSIHNDNNSPMTYVFFEKIVEVLTQNISIINLCQQNLFVS